MDTYENPGFQPESEKNAPKPKKDSPFADSPYYMEHQHREASVSHEAPQEPVYESDPQRSGYESDPRASYEPPVEPWESPKSQPREPWDEPYAAPSPKKKKRTGVKFLTGICAVLAVVALVVGSCFLTAQSVNDYWEERNAQTEQLLDQMADKIDDLQEQIKDNSYTGNGNSISGSTNTSAEGLSPGQVYAKNVDSVVAIANQSTSTNIYGQVTETASSGSGFIVSEDGYIITNYHVIEGATKLTVILVNGTEYNAKVIGYDAANDMAVLKVDATGLTPVTLGSSDDLIVGDQVVAIGNPLGELTNSLTVGYVSAKDRDISTGGALINMIQTDAAINSGNSGGPLFNMKGEVVGITTAKYSGTSGSGATIEGIGFAIPIDDVMKKINDLVNHGYLTGPYLGISVSDTDEDAAELFGIPRGAYVREVTPGYCAAQAGLKAKDVIVELGGYEVTCLNDLSRALEHFNAGDTVNIVVYRGGAQMTIEVTLDERPQTNNTDAGPSTVEPTTSNDLPENGSAEDWWDHFSGDGN